MPYKNYEAHKAYMRDYQKAFRAWASEHHVCARCKQMDKRTVNGYTYCEECAAWLREYQRRRKHGRTDDDI